jgi:hypothetical protein
VLFGGHGHDYFADTVAFALSLLLFVPVAALIVVSLLEEPLKARAAARARKNEVRPPPFAIRSRGSPQAAHRMMTPGSTNRI